MFIFYLIISILWGVLIFLHSFKELGYVASIIFTIVTIFIWPVFIPISIVIEIVNLSKEKKEDPTKLTEEDLINRVRENLKLDSNE